MPRFKDSYGDEWPISVTAGTIKRCKDALGIDLGDPLTPTLSFERWVTNEGFEPDKLTAEQRENMLRLWVRSAGPWITRFDTDIVFKVDLLFVVLEPEIQRRNMSPEDFAERLGGDSLQAANEGFVEALKDFFRSLGMTDRAKAIETQAAIVKRQIEAMEATLDGEAMETMIAREMQTAVAKAESALGSSAANTEPSPA